VRGPRREPSPACQKASHPLTRPYSECGRVIAEAVARDQWEEVGVYAQTPPTKHRPGTTYKVAEDVVTLYGKTYRAVAVYSSSQDQRWQKRLERELQAAYATLEATVRAMAQQTYFCRANAEAAAHSIHDDDQMCGRDLC